MKQKGFKAHITCASCCGNVSRGLPFVVESGYSNNQEFIKLADELYRTAKLYCSTHFNDSEWFEFVNPAQYGLPEFKTVAIRAISYGVDYEAAKRTEDVDHWLYLNGWYAF